MVKKALEPGVHFEKGRTIRLEPSYAEEVQNFDTNSKKKELPFVNQDNALEELVTRLTTKYPYAVFIGEPGIGKTMMLDWVTEAVKGEIPEEDIEEMTPHLVNAFKAIRERTSEFEHRDYILLPNMKDPMKVEGLSYQSTDEFERDRALAQSFTDQLGDLLGGYAVFYRDDIRMEMTKKDFGQYMNHKIAGFYADIYDQVARLTSPERLTTSKKKKEFALVTISPPDNMYRPANMKVNWKFITRGTDRVSLSYYKKSAGFESRRKDITKAEYEKGLAHTVILDRARPLLSNLLWELDTIDISDDPEMDKYEVFRKIFDKYTEEKIQSSAQKYQDDETYSQRVMLADIRTSNLFSPIVKVSGKTLDKMVEKIENLRNRYKEHECTEGLSNWMDSVISYFVEERSVLEKTVYEMLSEIREIDAENKPEIEERADAKKKSKEERDKEDKAPDDTYEDVSFTVKHGKYKMAIEDIMLVNDLPSPSSTERITSLKVRSFTKESLFGTFIDHKGSPLRERGDEEPGIPPHMTYTTLGSFFDGGILAFPDSFSDFIQLVTRREEGEDSMKERLLEYLQTGMLTVVNAGISYTLSAPRIIIGADNNDPFYTLTEGGVYVENQQGLRDRILAINVPYMATNSAEVRKGTLKVINDHIKRYNDESGREKMSMNREAVEIILEAGLMPRYGLANLEYRQLTQWVDQFLGFAANRGKKEVTLDVIKDWVKKQIHPVHKAFMEQERYPGGYVDLDEKVAGAVNGLGVYTTYMPAVANIRSWIVPDVDHLHEGAQRFESVDMNHDFTDKTHTKGFELSTDYLKQFLFGLRQGVKDPNSKGWQLKTQFETEWGGMGGPSASMAITASMLSALSGEGVYTNRFITGTLDPVSGGLSENVSAKAGIIGGTYTKALAPFFLRGIVQEETEKDRPMYCLVPFQNIPDLKSGLRIDPFGLEDKERGVVMLPYRNVEQAYTLLTCGEKITGNEWNNLNEFSKDCYADMRKKVGETIKKLEG